MTGRTYSYKSRYLDPSYTRYRSTHEDSHVRRWLRDLSDIEPQALGLLRPYDVRLIEPTLVKCASKLEHDIFNYFRVVISSEPQNKAVRAVGRGSEWLVLDEVSGTLLGLFSLGTMSLPWKPLTRWAGAQVGMDRWHRGPNTSHHVMQLSRCLPTLEFGPLTGGKLLALLATSRELVQSFELQYSCDFAVFVIKTHGGKSSQYNRLHERNIDFIGLGDEDAGAYLAVLRTNAKALLCGYTTLSGLPTTFPLHEQVRYWKSRWLPNRLDRTDDGWVKPDVERYRMSDAIRAKITARIAARKGPADASSLQDQTT